MNKTIDTLVEDIQALLVDGLDNIPEEIVEAFGERMGETLAHRIVRKEIEGHSHALRMSSIGKPCTRQLWYEHHVPEEGEPLNASTKLKFLYGDLLEEFILFLAELSGHRVEGRQDTLAVAGILGHRDAVIDGVLVDCKSASTYSFNKFKTHLTPIEDAFGYIGQLQLYLHASQDDALVTDKSRGAFLVIDKTLGHICLDFHDYQSDRDWGEFVQRRRLDIEDASTVPSRGFSDEPDGKSGNRKLSVNCSYCPFKKSCWPGLRTFIYYSGPVYLSRVVREPNVMEIT